jgi:Tol biopolymer transport system component
MPITVLRLSLLLSALLLGLLAVLIGLRPAEPRPLLLTASVGENAFRYDLRDPADGAAHRLIDRDTIHVNWSPDGNWLLYTRYEEGPFNQPGALNLSTGVDTYVNFDTYNALWSPDGAWLIYSHTGGSSAYVARVTAESILPGQELLPVNNALWSPDARYVYYLYYPPWEGQIARVEVACLSQGDCDPQNIPQGQYRIDGLLGWTPDGDLMVNSFNLENPNDPPELYTLDTETGQMRPLLPDILPGVAPAWSPDGALLAMSLLDTPEDARAAEPIPALYLIDSATGERKVLWAGVIGQPQWSPDGRWLSFEVVERVGGGRSVWVYEHATEIVRSLTPRGEFEASPQWGLYRGRHFDQGLPLSIVGALIASLWVTHRRHV